MEECEVQKRGWYVVHVRSQQERNVAKSLLDSIALYGLDEMFGDVRVPSEEVIEMRGAKRRRVTRNFYPGYVFVEMEMTDQTRKLVRETTHVLGFLGEKPLPAEEVARLLSDDDSGEEKAPRPSVVFEPGEVIRITDGPFSDFNGVVDRVNYEKSRLSVSVSIFGRETPVELEFSQVDKL